MPHERSLTIRSNVRKRSPAIQVDCAESIAPEDRPIDSAEEKSADIPLPGRVDLSTGQVPRIASSIESGAAEYCSGSIE